MPRDEVTLEDLLRYEAEQEHPPFATGRVGETDEDSDYVWLGFKDADRDLLFALRGKRVAIYIEPEDAPDETEALDVALRAFLNALRKWSAACRTKLMGPTTGKEGGR